VNGVQPYDDGSHLYADFCQEDFRAWYIQKSRIASISITGWYSWDMGWFDIYTGYAPSQGLEDQDSSRDFMRSGGNL